MQSIPENECIADHQNASQFDSKKLVDALFKHDPDIIILGSCFTNISVLNSILRASGKSFNLKIYF